MSPTLSVEDVEAPVQEAVCLDALEVDFRCETRLRHPSKPLQLVHDDAIDLREKAVARQISGF